MPDEKQYWRSIDRLMESPAVRELVARELPDGCDLSPDALTRRTLFRLLGASVALAGLTACRRPVEQILAYDGAPEGAILGIPRFYATTLALGTSAHGVVVETHEGRPTKVEGNELHPSSAGAASAWMQAAVLDLYDPDRLPHVLRRGADGARRESSWDELLAFWRGLSGPAESAGGEGLAVISEAYTSPTMARLVAAFRERFPKARWVVHEPMGDENIFEGLRLATGTAYRPVHSLANADVIVSLDSDFLLTESESVIHARDFASRRVPDSDMNRLYVAESVLSLTGANADHRLRLRSSEIHRFAVALARELGITTATTTPDGALPAHVRAKVRVVAHDLAGAGRHGVVIAGRRQPPEVHALAFATNHAIGAADTTVTFHELQDAAWSSIDDLSRLIADMRRGKIETLVMIGGNPAYTLPADLALAPSLVHVRNTVYLGTHDNETARLAQWSLPQGHSFETWGDARAADGTLSVVQPLIAPLFDSRSVIELTGLLSFDDASAGYDLVRQTWLETILGSEDAEPRWNRVLHDGLLKESALPAVVSSLTDGQLPAAVVSASAVPREEFELVFTPSPATLDGRFANNGWLQETPDPITRVTWDNPALISPAMAAGLELSSGDIVRLSSAGRALEAPVFVLPGMADGVIAIALGYGRSSAGRVGNGVGVNAYALRTSAGLHFAAAGIERTGRTHALAQTQEHWSMEGRPLIRAMTLAEARTARPREEEESPPLIEGPALTGEYQWGMAIDLSRCIGCNACVVACQSENNIPVVGAEQIRRGRTMQWLRVDRYFAGSPEDPEVAFEPVPCMHCENAPCEQVCPVGATVHDNDGHNVMVYNRCVGTRYCSNNCPYKVRRFNFFNYTKELPELVQMAMNPDVTIRSRGVMEKCSYCIQRTTEAKLRAENENRAVRDREVQTACQQTCPAQAIVFGNIRDSQSAVSRQKGDGRGYTLLDELNTKPRTSYLARIGNPNPDWERKS
jgi:molybdopterin-containing oxidoreductase family iron-sulfur binding subunit